MDSLQIAVLLGDRMSTAHALSARPDAPVVPETVSVWQRSRAAFAATLHRAADVVAPPVPATHTLSADARSGVARWDESRCRPSLTTSA